MTRYTETIMNRILADAIMNCILENENARYEKAVEPSYKFIVKRFNAKLEEGFDTPIRTFYNEQECVDWINSLESCDDEFVRVFGHPRRATVDNFTRTTFRISLDEPEFADFANRYNKVLDSCVGIHVCMTRI